MMKKGLIVLLLTFPLAMTACLEGDSEPDPMLPGYNIYNVASLQKNLALIPADAGIRLAMLLAEADKRELTDNRLDVEVDDTKLRTLLFDVSVTVSQEGSQYRVEYTKQGSMTSYYSYDGAIVVETGDRALSATDVDNAWTISSTGFEVYYGGSLAYAYENVPVRIYREGSEYIIDVEYSQIRYEATNQTSGCSGEFRLMAPAASLAYSDCHKENADYKLNGHLDGRSFSSLNASGTATQVKYEAANLYYKKFDRGWGIFSGTEKCSLPGVFDYDHTAYPSPDVEVIYKDGRGVMSYNGVQR